jgi:hypothetical protein
MGNTCDFQMFGQTWKCVRKARHGAECFVNTRTIALDEKMDEEDFLNYLHHELMEAATYHAGCTFTKEFPDNDTIFLMTHSQMDMVSSEVRGAYESIKTAMLPIVPSAKKKGLAQAKPSPDSQPS